MFCLYMNVTLLVIRRVAVAAEAHPGRIPMNRLLSGVCAGALMLASGAGTALAGDLPGKFDGVTVDVKLIGGQQYEKLYERIPEWEKATGAKVNILTKKNGFDIDKELKSDIASGSTNWCVGWNHSSFAPQY